MLSRITIRNLVIVRELDLAFAPGMTALTGETGAGKSILIDALGLALGDKADGGLIRAGAERAEITAGFEVPPASPAAAWLADNDLDVGGECLLRRVLVRDGRGRAYVNGTPVPQIRLREFAEHLVDIHGQHAHQTLLRPTAQRQLLDAYGGHADLLRDVAGAYRDWREATQSLATLEQASADRAARLDYLDFQIAELDGIACAPDQLAALEGEHARLSHAERLLADGAAVIALLDGDEANLRAGLAQAAASVAALARLDPALDEGRELLESAVIQVDEAAATLRRYQDQVDLDPQRLAEIDDQLARLHDAARKHRVEPAALQERLRELRQEAETLRNAERDLGELAARVHATERTYRSAAERLAKARRRAARTLSKTVTESMQTLGMRGGHMEVVCESRGDDPAVHGTDHVVYRVAANPGQPAGRLADVASGGELSRISLAIQVATARCGPVPTLIFDEVDVGIGGATAEIVGQLLRCLGADRQVLCVTHLAQVAAQAHRQMRVHKLTDGQTTETRIEALDGASRVDEVARMLGGVDITEQTRRHATEMIEHAQRSA